MERKIEERKLEKIYPRTYREYKERVTELCRYFSSRPGELIADIEGMFTDLGLDTISDQKEFNDRIIRQMHFDSDINEDASLAITRSLGIAIVSTKIRQEPIARAMARIFDNLFTEQLRLCQTILDKMVGAKKAVAIPRPATDHIEPAVRLYNYNGLAAELFTIPITEVDDHYEVALMARIDQTIDELRLNRGNPTEQTYFIKSLLQSIISQIARRHVSYQALEEALDLHNRLASAIDVYSTTPPDVPADRRQAMAALIGDKDKTSIPGDVSRDALKMLDTILDE